MKFSIKLIKDVGYNESSQQVAIMLLNRCYPNKDENSIMDYDEALSAIRDSILPTDKRSDEWIQWFVNMRYNNLVLKYYNTELRVSLFKTNDGNEFETYQQAYEHIDTQSDENFDSLVSSLTVSGINTSDGIEAWHTVNIEDHSVEYEKYGVFGIDSQYSFFNSYEEALAAHQEDLIQLSVLKTTSSTISQLIKSECGQYEAWDLVFPTL